MKVLTAKPGPDIGIKTGDFSACAVLIAAGPRLLAACILQHGGISGACICKGE
jgi:hypothetical protein